MDIEAVYSQLDAARISQYVAEAEEETLYLDFKTTASADMSSSDDRRNLATAISGFANSSGGLIVWGVDARKQSQDAPDVAIGVKEFEDVQLFVTRVNEHTGTCVSPIVDRVRTRQIATTGRRGFAVTIVPESAAGPHMANAREGRYYKRSGSAFYRMEHYDIADMFGRRQRPLLELDVRIAARGAMRTGTYVEHHNAIALYLVNRGRGSARNLFARVRVNKPFKLSHTGPSADGRGGLSLISDVSSQERLCGGDPHLVVHPGMEQGIAAIAFAYDQSHPEIPDLEVRLEIAADDYPLRTIDRTVSAASIVQQAG